MPSNHSHLEGLVNRVAQQEVGACMSDKCPGVWLKLLVGGEERGPWRTIALQPVAVREASVLPDCMLSKVCSGVYECCCGFMRHY